ncbi:MAG: bifunctional chorismate-binding protein/class IV aminotransferase [Leptonema sp. (in: bacteria)]
MIFLFPKRIIDENLSEWMYFDEPDEKWILQTKDKVNLEIIQQFFLTLRKKQKYYFCGFFSYEFSNILFNLQRNKDKKKLFELPLLYGGFFKNCKTFLIDLRTIKKESYLRNFKILESLNHYKKNIESIQNLIYKGVVYQINYTFPIQLSLYGNLQNLFFHLWKNQKSIHSAFIFDKDFFVLSISPELFFEIQNSKISLRPMKGTHKKSNSLRESIRYVESLKSNPKEKAENAMIVDLIRNDLGKISRIGTIKLEEVFKIEIYKTLIQMVTVITGELKTTFRDISLWEALFPSGSITGAPKISAMKFINTLEKFTRELYTGSIGYITPENTAKFNVAIRTIFGNLSKGYYYTGSGITIDSNAKKEYEECLLKAKLLKKTQQSLKPQYIFTTMKFSGGIFYFKKSHFQRLVVTKNFFSIPIQATKIYKRMGRLEQLLRKINKPLKIHFRIYKNGKIKIDLNSYQKKKYIKFAISSKTIQSNHIFLKYKTNHREIYDNELKIAQSIGFDEVLFMNEKHNITEGSYTNIILKLDKSFYTPNYNDGLLKGIFLEKLIKKFNIQEKTITINDVLRCEKIYLVNSVRGIMIGNKEFIFLHQ